MGTVYLVIFLLIVVGFMMKKWVMFFVGLFLGVVYVLGSSGLPNTSSNNAAQLGQAPAGRGNGITQVSPQTDGSGNIVVKQNGQTVIIPPMFPPQKQPDK